MRFAQIVLDHIEELEDTYLAAERLNSPGRRWTQSQLEQGLDLER